MNEPWVGDLGPGHLHGVGQPFVQRPLGVVRVNNAALQHDQGPPAGCVAHGSAQVAVEGGGDVGIGTVGRT